MRTTLDQAQFVRLWQESATLAEFCQAAGYAKKGAATHRASRLRVVGVKLKYFAPRRSRSRVKVLNQIIKSLEETK